MRSRRPELVEWGFVAALAVLCAVLTVLQYRWTGEVARAEAQQLRGNLGEQAEALGRAFDATLAASCSELLPSGHELAEQGREAAHAARMRAWQAGNPRPIFRRVAVAVPAGRSVQLHALDLRTGALVQMDWPAEWSALRDNLFAKLAGGSPPFFDRNGMLLEFPVTNGRPGDENEWLILELDLAYVRDAWLPALAKAHLNPGDMPLNDFEVVVASNPAATPILAAPASSRTPDSPAATVRFNRAGKTMENSRGPVNGTTWLLRVWRHPDALEQVVSASRRRNFAIAVGINLLILAAGAALVFHVRRTRALADAQMGFVATVSHELRTPLTVIRGAAHNLQRGVVSSPERIARYSGLIGRHAEQLGEMVEQVLEFSAAQKKPELARQPVAIAEVLRESVAAAEPDTQAARCEVELDLPPALPALAGDPAALRRVFQNLLANAARHGGSGGWIGVSAAVTNGTEPPAVEVRVADRGPGVPATEQAGIFEPFARGVAAREQQTRGSGLGLALVREIVEAHAGGVSVQSEPGRGAIFIVRLPLPSPVP